MATSSTATEMVKVYRRSTKTKVPYPVPRSHMRFNPDLRVVPSDPSKRRKLELKGDEDEEAPVAQTNPDTGAESSTSTTTSGPQSGSENERK